MAELFRVLFLTNIIKLFVIMINQQKEIMNLNLTAVDMLTVPGNQFLKRRQFEQPK